MSKTALSHNGGSLYPKLREIPPRKAIRPELDHGVSKKQNLGVLISLTNTTNAIDTGVKILWRYDLINEAELRIYKRINRL